MEEKGLVEVSFVLCFFGCTDPNVVTVENQDKSTRSKYNIGDKPFVSFV